MSAHKGFNREHPNLKICLRTGLSRHILKKVLEYQCDIGIIGRVEYPQDIIRREIGPQRLVMVASPTFDEFPNERIKIEDLTGKSVIMREQGSATSDFLLKKFQDRKVEPKVVMESENPDAIKRSVDLGVGFAFLPYFSVHEELERGAFREITIIDEDLSLKLDAIYLRSRRRSSLIRACLDILSNLSLN